MIRRIQSKIGSGEYEFSLHATDQSILRRISTLDIEQAVASGEIIEDYPGDKYGPSCLVFGMNANGRPLHIQCTYPDRPILKFITVYEPDPNEWLEWKYRRQRESL